MLQIPPVEFANELKTSTGHLFKVLEGTTELTPAFEGRVRVALGLCGRGLRGGAQ